MTKKLASLLALATVAGNAHAADTYSNLEHAPGRYVAGSAYFINPTQFNKGWQFTATASGTLSGIQIALNNDNPSDGPLGFTLSLYADNGSTDLGTLLGAYAGLSTGASLYTESNALSSVAITGSPVTITAGAKYWLIANSGGALGWNETTTDIGAPFYAFNEYFGSARMGAFSVQVNPVPEPTALVVFGAGAVLLTRRRRRS